MEYKNFFYKNYEVLIISSIIPLLIWGPFFPDLIVSSCAIFFLIMYLKTKIIITS